MENTTKREREKEKERGDYDLHMQEKLMKTEEALHEQKQLYEMVLNEKLECEKMLTSCKENHFEEVRSMKISESRIGKGI